MITSPGIYELDPEVYHGDPTPGGSLSPTRAKVLLEPGGPARFHWRRTHPQPPSTAFDDGHTIHKLVLGRGEDVAIIDAADWRSKGARDERDEARANGLVPVLAKRYDELLEMAGNALANPRFAEVLAGANVEQAMFAEIDGIWLRGQADAIGPGVIADVKTTGAKSPEDFARAAFKYGYAMQAAWYQRLARELGLGDCRFVHLVIEKEPPYLSYVAEMDSLYLTLGQQQMDDAIAIYRRCLESGQWPGYDPDPYILSAPEWALDDEIEF